MEAFKQRCKQIVTQDLRVRARRRRRGGAGPDRDVRQPARPPAAGGRRADRVGAAAGAAPAGAGRRAGRGRRAHQPPDGRHRGAAARGRRWCCRCVHELRRYPLRDQVYRPTASASAEGAAPFQTVEGLSVGVVGRRALRAGPRSRRRHRQAAARERRPGADRAGRRRRAAPLAGQAHRARDLHGQARRDPGRHRAGAARRCWRKDGIVLRVAVHRATSICRRSTARAWRACSPRSWRPRRCATRCS